jgi:hypothetical protein
MNHNGANDPTATFGVSDLQCYCRVQEVSPDKPGNTGLILFVPKAISVGLQE